MRNLGLMIAFLVLAGSLGFGGWKYARNEGWIAGAPDSPRPENFKRVLDAWLPHTLDPQKRLCANVGYGSAYGRFTGFPDTQFQYTPTAFHARLSADPALPLRKRLDLFARHGLLKKALRDGEPEYTLTWQGFAASNGAGCFHLAGIERDVQVLDHKKLRVERSGETVYQVVARPRPALVAAWARDPEFQAVFESDGMKYGAETDPQPVVYEVGRLKGSLRVLGEQAAAGRPVLAGLASDAPPLAPIEAPRLLGLVEAYIARGGGTRNHVCVDGANMGADETVLDPPATPGQQGVPRAFAFYNLPERTGVPLRKALLGYETMRRLESLGMATSELLAVGAWGARPAAGGVRFEVSQALKDYFVPQRGCFAVGTVKAESIVVAEKFSVATARPRFWARMRMVPIAGREPVVEKFGHLARMRNEGFPAWGTVERSASGELQVSSVSWYHANFDVDPAQVRLPRVEPAFPKPAPKPAAPQAQPQERKAMKPERFARPLRPTERLMHCGRDTIICDEKDTVVCDGRPVRCQ
jgi:hypothetical protein